MQTLLRSARLGFVGVSLLAACVARPPVSSGEAACTAKDKSKYDPASLQEIETRLSREASQASWDEVPEPYRAWAAERLTLKVRHAAATLAEANNCREVEAAASKIRPLGKRIAEAARKCTDQQCLTKHSQPPEIDRELELALCPLYPFC
jgi:hypothetical protein